MVRHPDVRRVGVVGSVATGKIIAKAAAEDLTHVTLELGVRIRLSYFPMQTQNRQQVCSQGINMNRQSQFYLQGSCSPEST